MYQLVQKSIHILIWFSQYHWTIFSHISHINVPKWDSIFICLFNLLFWHDIQIHYLFIFLLLDSFIVSKNIFCFLNLMLKNKIQIFISFLNLLLQNESQILFCLFSLLGLKQGSNIFICLTKWGSIFYLALLTISK